MKAMFSAFLRDESAATAIEYALIAAGIAIAIIGAVNQLRAAKIEVTIDSEIYPNGRFARLYDPEGNPIELWEPK